MNLKTALVLSILMLCSTGVQGQSSFDIERKYGKRVNVYSVGERLWMSPSYDKQGQICLMRVFPKTVSENTNYHDPDLDIEATLRFINELVPVHTRGRRAEDAGMSDLGGGIVWTRFNFEHVSFVFVSSFHLTKRPETDLGTFVDLDSPHDEAAAAEYRRQEAMKSDDQIIRERAFSARVLEISWPNRKCK